MINFFKKFNFWGDLVPDNYEELSKDKEYINYLNNRIGWLNATKGIYKGVIKSSEKLINYIEVELKNREY